MEGIKMKIRRQRGRGQVWVACSLLPLFTVWVCASLGSLTAELVVRQDDSLSQAASKVLVKVKKQIVLRPQWCCRPPWLRQEDTTRLILPLNIILALFWDQEEHYLIISTVVIISPNYSWFRQQINSLGVVAAFVNWNRWFKCFV